MKFTLELTQTWNTFLVLNCISIIFFEIYICDGADVIDTSKYVEELPNGDIRPVVFNHALRKWMEEDPIHHINYATNRIVGGRESTISEVPYQVAILIKNRGIWCGGAIYNEDTVISAAHCFSQSIPLSQFVFVAGKTDLRKKEDRYEQMSAAKSVILHPDYSIDPPVNDLAIVKLKTPFCFNGNTQPIPIPTTSSEKAQGNAGVSGWGYTERREVGSTTLDPSKYGKILKVTQLDIIEKAECLRIYSSYVSNARDVAGHESVFCAGSKIGDDTCQGDSGGPVVCQDIYVDKYLCGVVSTGIGCGLPGLPAFYTELSLPKFRQWIREIGGAPSEACEGDVSFNVGNKPKNTTGNNTIESSTAVTTTNFSYKVFANIVIAIMNFNKILQ